MRRVRLALVVASLAAVGWPMGRASAATPPAPKAQLWVESTGLEFGPVDTGTTTAPQTVAIHNTGDATLSGLSIASPGSPFGLTTTCGSTLAPGGQCTASYTFAPTAFSTSTKTSVVSSSAGSASITMSGTGNRAIFPLSVIETAIDFGTIRSPGTSSTEQVEVINQTSSAVTFTLSGLDVVGEFSADATVSGGCAQAPPRMLLPGEMCRIDVAMVSKSVATHNGSVSFLLSVAGGPSKSFSTGLTGIGTQGLVLSPTKLDFGLVSLGTTSPTLTTTLTNTGSSPVAYTSIDVPQTVNFSRTVSCPSGSSLAPGASCTFTYQAGSLTSTTATGTTLPVLVNAGQASASLPLTLTATGTLGVVSRRSTVDFGEVATGSGASDSIVLTNTTSGPLTFGASPSIQSGSSPSFLPGGTTCTGTVAAGASCVVGVSFSPSAAGSATGTMYVFVTFPGTNSGYGIFVQLTGTGVSPAFPPFFPGPFPIRLDTRAIDYGQVQVGGTARFDALVKNTSTSSVTVNLSGALTPGNAAFTLTNSCGTTITLAAGASCALQYAFRPTGEASVSSSVTPAFTVGSTTKSFGSVTLNGTGVNGVVFQQAGIAWGTRYMYVDDFVEQTVGEGFAPQDLFLTNTSGYAVSFTSTGMSSPNSAVAYGTNTCVGAGGAAVSLAAGAACKIQAGILPQTEQTVSTAMAASVTFVGASSARSYNVPFTWTGAFPWRLSARQIDFGDVFLGSSAMRSVFGRKLVTGVGWSPTPSVSTSPPTGPFTWTSDLVNTPNVQASISLMPRFAPTATGSASTSMQLFLPIPSTPKIFTIGLSGYGQPTAGNLVVSPNSIDFGPVPKGATVTRDVTLTNAGRTKVDDINLAGPADGISLGKSCPPLDPGASCTLHPTFTGDGSGNVATLTGSITSSVAPHAISLTGTHSPSYPTAPTGVTATAGDRQATVSWSGPGSDGGFPITTYRVTPYQGTTALTAQLVTAPTTTAVIPLLSNGVAYTFVVDAMTSVGWGPDSAASIPIVPGRIPDPPGQPAVVGGDGSVAISWTVPADDGGHALTGYVVTPYVGDEAQATVEVAADVTTTAITGLANGTAYTFRVAAVNDLGRGPDSASSDPVVPARTPDAPSSVTGVPGDGSVALSWLAPSSDGGHEVTAYVVTPNDGEADLATVTFDGLTTSGTVHGLTNGVPYTFTVAAVNDVGTSAPSASSLPVVPGRAPDAPSGIVATAGNSSVTVGWSIPASGGHPISGYQVTPYEDGVALAPISRDASVTSTVIGGLTNGRSYRFTVTASNDLGTSASSASSAAVVPFGVVVTSDADPSVSGQAVTLKARATPGAGGTMTFLLGSTVLATKSASGGVASLLTAKLPVGDDIITAVYQPSATAPAQTSLPFVQHVLRGATTTTVSSTPSSSVFGQSVKVKAVVSPVSPAAGIPSGSVTFYEGDASLGTATLSNGTASVTVKPAVGSHPIVAVFAGSASWAGSASAPMEHVVGRAETSTAVSSSVAAPVSGQQFSVKVKVSTILPGTGTPTGNVSLYDGGAFVSTKSLLAGAASWTVKPSVGDHDWSVVYEGSATHAGSSGTLSLAVARAATRVTVSSSYPTTTYGHSGYVTATVTTISPGTGTPTGNVEFYERDVLVAVRPVNAGKANLPIASLSRGVHELVAVYLGSATHAGSTAAPFTQTVT